MPFDEKYGTSNHLWIYAWLIFQASQRANEPAAFCGFEEILLPQKWESVKNDKEGVVI